MTPLPASAFGATGQGGQVIHSNAGTILRLEPEDDDEEDERRKEAEERARQEIEAALQQQLDAVLGEGFSGEGRLAQADEVEHRLNNSSGSARLALERALTEGADLGVRLVERQLAGIGLAFNYRLVHVLAQQWAQDYSYELIRGINNTSRRAVETALIRWIESGAPLSELRQALEPSFGEVRAKRIASTEVTRAYAEGALRSYASAGYGDGRPTVAVPLHPECRCFYSLEILEDGSAYWIFNTSRDDHVCPICRPYHQQRVGLARRGR
jgi:hypothetical protein